MEEMVRKVMPRMVKCLRLFTLGGLSKRKLTFCYLQTQSPRATKGTNLNEVGKGGRKMRQSTSKGAASTGSRHLSPPQGAGPNILPLQEKIIIKTLMLYLMIFKCGHQFNNK